MSKKIDKNDFFTRSCSPNMEELYNFEMEMLNLWIEIAFKTEKFAADKFKGKLKEDQSADKPVNIHDWWGKKTTTLYFF